MAMFSKKLFPDLEDCCGSDDIIFYCFQTVYESGNVPTVEGGRREAGKLETLKL